MKLFKNKKGAIGEALMFVLIMFMVLSGLLAVLEGYMISRKSIGVANLTTELARTIAVQGGVLDRAPAGYPGGDEAYTDFNEAQNLVRTQMTNLGFRENQYQITLNNQPLVNNQEVDYRQTFTVAINARQPFTFVSKVFRLQNVQMNYGTSRSGVSEWKYDYNTWNGE